MMFCFWTFLFCTSVFIWSLNDVLFCTNILYFLYDLLCVELTFQCCCYCLVPVIMHHAGPALCFSIKPSSKPCAIYPQLVMFLSMKTWSCSVTLVQIKQLMTQLIMSVWKATTRSGNWVLCSVLNAAKFTLCRGWGHIMMTHLLHMKITFYISLLTNQE